MPLDVAKIEPLGLTGVISEHVLLAVRPRAYPASR